MHSARRKDCTVLSASPLGHILVFFSRFAASSLATALRELFSVYAVTQAFLMDPSHALLYVTFHAQTLAFLAESNKRIIPEKNRRTGNIQKKSERRNYNGPPFLAPGVARAHPPLAPLRAMLATAK